MRRIKECFKQFCLSKFIFCKFYDEFPLIELIKFKIYLKIVWFSEIIGIGNGIVRVGMIWMDIHTSDLFRKILRLESIFNDTLSPLPNSILRSFPRFSTLTNGSVFGYQVIGSHQTSFSNVHTRLFLCECACMRFVI